MVAKTGSIGERLSALGVAAALAAMMLLVPSGSAQTPVSEQGDVAHPAHIHAGSCAELGEVVAPLADVVYPAGEQAGAAGAHPVMISLNVVDLPLADILAGDHAVNIHLSADEIGTYIACGDIGGMVVPGETGDDELRFAVTELNDSGYTGVVFLGAAGDQSEVNIMLIAPEAMS